jgi:hypothetical protein
MRDFEAWKKELAKFQKICEDARADIVALQLKVNAYADRATKRINKLQGRLDDEGWELEQEIAKEEKECDT